MSILTPTTVLQSRRLVCQSMCAAVAGKSVATRDEEHYFCKVGRRYAQHRSRGCVDCLLTAGDVYASDYMITRALKFLQRDDVICRGNPITKMGSIAAQDVCCQHYPMVKT